METPLWTDAHAPALADLPQREARQTLQRAAEEPMHLVVHGPTGCGKTAAVRALAEAAHGDRDALVELNLADFFDRTKTEIRNDPRFAHFLQGEIPWVKQLGASERQSLSKRYKSDWSKADMAKHVLDELASYQPGSSAYKTVLLDNAEAVREDFQQALRRTIERHHETTQFVIATRQPSKLIPPIRSRCFPVPMRAPDAGEVVAVLEGITDVEGVDYEPEGLEYVAGYADGDLRKAILGAQTTHEDHGAITMEAAYEALGEVGTDQVAAMLDDAEAGEFTDARSTLDDLLVDGGYSGREVLDAVLREGRSRYDGRRLAELHRLAGEAEFDLVEGTSDRVHLAHLLAELGADA